MIVESEGDVRFVNQKITVGENLVINAKNFEALAGENTYSNSTKSSSMGVNAGYDIVNQNALGGANVSSGNSNTTSKNYDNTFISAGGIFQLTTTEDATFKGANVIADKINFDIGKNLNIISLQDEYKSHGENTSAGVNVSGKLPGTNAQQGYAIPTIGGGFSQNDAESKWVSNQTSILANNGGSIKVGETLTNIGAIVGSLSEDNKLGIDAKKVVIENLEDYNKGENYGLQVSGIGVGPENKTPIGQTAVQYGSHDKEQNTNATFVNTEITENGVKLDLEKLGINTDITKAQVITKDKVVDQIDTVLHTDLLNPETRNQVIKDINGLIQLPGDIIKAVTETNAKGGNVLDNLVGTLRETDGNLIKYQEMNEKYKELKEDSGLTKEQKEEKAAKYATEMANELRGVYGIEPDVEIVIHFTDKPKGEEIGAFVREDNKIEIYLNPKEIDLSDMNQVYSGLGFEMNHFNPSNPYVYDKTEEQAGKGNSLEELFTGIGRKPIDGHENSFYNDVLKGGSVLEHGNALYGKIDESKLDFCGNPIQCPYTDFDYKNKQSIPRKPIQIDMPIGAGIPLSDIAITIQTGIEARKKDKEEKEEKEEKKVKVCNSACQAKEAKILADKIEKEKREKEEFQKLINPEDNLENLKEYSSFYGLPLTTKIVVEDKNGNKVFFDSLLEFQVEGNKEEQQALKWYSDKINDLEKEKTKAKTKEERNVIDNQLNEYYNGQTSIMKGIQERGSLAGRYTTGTYLTNSAKGYDGNTFTLTVSKEGMENEVGAERIGIMFEGAGKIATGIWGNQKINAEANLSQKYNNDTVKYSDSTYNGERNSNIDFINGKGKSTLESHSSRHGENVGAKSEKEYIDKARNFLEKPANSTTKSFVSEEGTYFRYDTATNEFGIINKYGGVSTYFKPEESNYWETQVKLYAPK